MQPFRDRHEAGARLALALQGYAERPDALILALPRGGVPVGYELSTRLLLPLDVLVVRKLGVPGHAELAMGAIASGGIEVIEDSIVSALGIPDEEIRARVRAEQPELERREREFRGDRPPLDVRDKTVILVDDGLATGSTMRAAIQAIRQRGPAAVVVAVPVAARQTCTKLEPLADEMVCLVTPPRFFAVGAWYRDFSQTSDAEVRTLLHAAAQVPTPAGEASGADPIAAPDPAANQRS